MSTRVGVIINFKNLGFSPLSEMDLRARMSRLSISHIAPFLGWISNIIQSNPDNVDFQLRLAEFLPADLRSKLLEVANSLQKPPIWVSLSNIRLVLKMLLEEGKTEGGMSMEDIEASHNLCFALLSVEPLFRHNGKISFSKGPERWLEAFVLLKNEGLIASWRALDTLEHKEAVYEKVFENAEVIRKFQAKFLCEPSDVQFALFALFATFTNQAIVHPQSPFHPFTNYKQLFGKLKISKAAGNLVVSKLCHDLNSSMAIEPSEVPWGNNLKFLVRQPLAVDNNDRICCLDLNFFTSNYARFMYELLCEILTKSEQNRLIHEVGGQVFENECAAALKIVNGQRKNQRSEFQIWTPLEDSQQALEIDGVVRDGKEIVLIECKVGVLAPGRIYARDINGLREEILKKFVDGIDRKGKRERKGFAQLARSAKLICDTPSIVGISRVKKIYPVLVIEDDDLQCKPLLFYLLAEAMRKFDFPGGKVAHPVVLRLEDLFLLAQRSAKFEFPDMIRRLTRDGIEGFNFSEQILRKLPISKTEAVETFREFKLSDKGFAKIEALSIDEIEWKCETCGQSEELIFEDTGSMFHQCLKCSSGTCTKVTGEELEKMNKLADQWIRDYENS